MSLITEIFGSEILKANKYYAMALIKSSPLITTEEEEKYLRDWGAATGTELTSRDYEILKDMKVE